MEAVKPSAPPKAGTIFVQLIDINSRTVTLRGLDFEHDVVADIKTKLQEKLLTIMQESNRNTALLHSHAQSQQPQVQPLEEGWPLMHLRMASGKPLQDHILLSAYTIQPDSVLVAVAHARLRGGGNVLCANQTVLCANMGGESLGDDDDEEETERQDRLEQSAAGLGTVVVAVNFDEVLAANLGQLVDNIGNRPRGVARSHSPMSVGQIDIETSEVQAAGPVGPSITKPDCKALVGRAVQWFYQNQTGVCHCLPVRV